MQENSIFPINQKAHNFQVCLADFPAGLKPEHLKVPAEEQPAIFEGLQLLYAAIRNLYDYYSRFVPTGKAWTDRDYCSHAVEAPVKLLWALGISGSLVHPLDGWQLQVNRAELDPALKRSGAHEPARAFNVLESLGFHIEFRDVKGEPCPAGWKKCISVVIHPPAGQELLLPALVYYAARLPKNQFNPKHDFLLEVFLRGDFRPLQPGYTCRGPHLPAEEQEVTRTFDPATMTIWNEISAFMKVDYPQYKVFFRVPRSRNRAWVVDYSTKDNDYGLFSMMIDEKGVTMRIVLVNNTLPALLEHLTELTPGFQEPFLNAIGCKDCSHCGKHLFFTHSGHVHKLCVSPWYYPSVSLENIPDIERLIKFRLDNAN